MKISYSSFLCQIVGQSVNSRNNLNEDISSFAKQNPLFGAEIADGLRKFPVDGKTQVLSAGTVTDYQQEIALDAQLKNRFQKIEIKSNDQVADDSFVESNCFAGVLKNKF